MVIQNDANTGLTQLMGLKTKNEALVTTNESTEKAKIEAKAKIKQLLQDKSELKKTFTQRLRLR